MLDLSTSYGLSDLSLITLKILLEIAPSLELILRKLVSCFEPLGTVSYFAITMTIEAFGVTVIAYR